MKSYNYSESNYILIDSQQLDRLIEREQPSKQNSIKLPTLKQLWNSILDALTRSSEPKIYQKRGYNGNLYFEVYDPIAHQTSTFNSEQEVRIWLDQRYYQ